MPRVSMKETNIVESRKTPKAGREDETCSKYLFLLHGASASGDRDPKTLNSAIRRRQGGITKNSHEMK